MSNILDALCRDFLAHRRSQRRGAFPQELRRRAVAELDHGQRLTLAKRVGLTAAQVTRWEESPSLRAEAEPFFEIPASPPPTPPVATADCLEVETRQGVVLRLRGKVDPEVITALVGALTRTST